MTGGNFFSDLSEVQVLKYFLVIYRLNNLYSRYTIYNISKNSIPSP